MSTEASSPTVDHRSLRDLRELSVSRERIAVFAVLLAVGATAPLAHQQLVTGTIVNATLILGVCLLGAREGLLLGLFPSTIALATGLLPPVLAPMVTFVIVGNAILVLAFDHLRRLSYWAAVGAAAVLKFVFLFATTDIVIGLLLNHKVASNVSAMMGAPQLATALAGGVVAFGVLKVLRRPEPAQG